VLIVTCLVPPVLETVSLVGLSVNVQPIVVVVVVVLEMLDVVVGSGALASDRNIEKPANDKGLGEQVLVPAAPPIH